MIAYVDTSVLLRVVLREPGAVEDLQSYDSLVWSELIAVESARTIDRLRLTGALTLEEAAERSRSIAEWLEAFDVVLLRPPVLNRAGERGPRHSAHWTRSTWRPHCCGANARAPLATLMTHDGALGVTARTFGFDVRGV